MGNSRVRTSAQPEGRPVTVLFVTAMATFFLGLVWFLREIYLGTVSLRIGAR